jgi:glycosyltransferase involved in cell wall biosynthesis
MKISVIIPFLNERHTLGALQSQLESNLSSYGNEYELIFVDDGSTDDSAGALQKDSHTHLISLRKHRGKGRALQEGFNASRGEIIVFMDADLQDDPEDIKKFIEKIDEGYDFANGWRKIRNDPSSKTLPSRIFNQLLLRKLLRSPLHDMNCGYKALRRDVLLQIPLYGDNYRFLPHIAAREGFHVTEVQVQHHPRKHGVSKYGFWRMLFGFFDTLTTYFIYQFSEKPLHFFGPIGVVSFLLGFIIMVGLGIERLFFGVELYKRPIVLLGMLLIIVGLQVVLTGITAELIVYFDQRRRA